MTLRTPGKIRAERAREIDPWPPDAECPWCHKGVDVENDLDHHGHLYDGRDIIRCPHCERRIDVVVEIKRVVTISKP